MTHLYMLKPFWENKDRFWATFDKEDARSLLKGEKLGIKTIYIEVFDRIDKPTVSGKICYPVTDKFIVEWEEMKKYIRKLSIWEVSFEMEHIGER